MLPLFGKCENEDDDDEENDVYNEFNPDPLYLVIDFSLHYLLVCALVAKRLDRVCRARVDGALPATARLVLSLLNFE